LIGLVVVVADQCAGSLYWTTSSTSEPKWSIEQF
jgi:hypothetical protein